MSDKQNYCVLLLAFITLVVFADGDDIECGLGACTKHDEYCEEALITCFRCQDLCSDPRNEVDCKVSCPDWTLKPALEETDGNVHLVKEDLPHPAALSSEEKYCGGVTSCSTPDEYCDEALVTCLKCQHLCEDTRSEADCVAFCPDWLESNKNGDEINGATDAALKWSLGVVCVALVMTLSFATYFRSRNVARPRRQEHIELEHSSEASAAGSDRDSCNSADSDVVPNPSPSDLPIPVESDENDEPCGLCHVGDHDEQEHHAVIMVAEGHIYDQVAPSITNSGDSGFVSNPDVFFSCSNVN